jgi:2-methylcitrate dehydratase PrpD
MTADTTGTADDAGTGGVPGAMGAAGDADIARAPDSGASARPALAAGLAEFAAGLRRDQISEQAASYAATLTLDAVGCSLAGWAAEETPLILRAARHLGGDGEATVIGDAEPASPLAAVLANSYLSTAVTACDVYTPAHCHLTPEVVPAALAVAEAEHATGKAFLTAVTAGLEVTSRLLRAIDYAEFRRRGWHSPGVFGPVGAAVAAGLLLGLDAGRLRTAMSLAVSQAAGTFAAWPTTAVKFHQARGAAAGLLAARLAAEGFEAGREPFEAPDGGLFASYSPGDPALALAGLGSSWELERISLRLWPGATPVQALLTALLAAGQPLPAPGDLVTAEIRVPPATYEAHRGVAHPNGCFEALLSFHFVTAATIMNARFGIDLTDSGNCARPDVAAFIDEHVTLVPDPDVPRGGVQLTLTTRTGAPAVIRQDHALGTPQHPAARYQVEAKFLHGAAGRLGPAPAEDLLARLNRLDEAADCAGLLGLTRRVPGLRRESRSSRCRTEPRS